MAARRLCATLSGNEGTYVMAGVFWTIVVFVFVVSTIGIAGYAIGRMFRTGSDHHQPQH